MHPIRLAVAMQRQRAPQDEGAGRLLEDGVARHALVEVLLGQLEGVLVVGVEDELALDRECAASTNRAMPTAPCRVDRCACSQQRRRARRGLRAMGSVQSRRAIGSVPSGQRTDINRRVLADAFYFSSGRPDLFSYTMLSPRHRFEIDGAELATQKNFVKCSCVRPSPPTYPGARPARPRVRA